MGDVFVFGAGVCSSGIVMPISKLQDVSDTSDSEEERWKPTLILPVLINESEADKGASLVKREITEANTSGPYPGEIVISVAPALPLPPVDFDLGEEEHFPKSRFDSKENDEEWIPDMQEASESEEDEWFSEEPEEVLSPVRSYKRLKRGLRSEKHLNSNEVSTNRQTRSKRKMLKSTNKHVMVDFGSNHTNVSEVTERSPANPLSAFAGEVRDDIPDADVHITVEEPIPSEMTTAPALPSLNFDHDEDKHFSKLRFDSKDSDEEEWTPDPHEASDNEEEEWSPVRVHKRIKRGLRSEKHLKSLEAFSNQRTRSKRKLLKSTQKQVTVDFGPNHANISEAPELCPTKQLSTCAGEVEIAVRDANLHVVTVEEPIPDDLVVSTAPALYSLTVDHDEEKHFSKSRFDSKESDEEEWIPDMHEASDSEEDEWSSVRLHRRFKRRLRSEKHLKSLGAPSNRQTRSKRKPLKSTHKQVLVDFDPNHTNASESVPTKVLTAFAGDVENAVPDAGVDITVEEPLPEVVVSVAPALSPLNFDHDKKKHFPKSRCDSKESDEEEWTPDPHEASDNEDEEWVVDEPEVLSPVRFYKRLKRGLRSEKHLKSPEDPISRQTPNLKPTLNQLLVDLGPSDTSESEEAEWSPIKPLTAFAGEVEDDHCVPDVDGLDLNVDEPIPDEEEICVTPVLPTMDFNPDEGEHFPKSRFASAESEEWTPDPHEASDSKEEEWVTEKTMAVVSPGHIYNQDERCLRSKRFPISLKVHEKPQEPSETEASQPNSKEHKCSIGECESTATVNGRCEFHGSNCSLLGCKKYVLREGKCFQHNRLAICSYAECFNFVRDDKKCFKHIDGKEDSVATVSPVKSVVSLEMNMNIGAPKTLVSNFDTHKTASIARAIVEFSSDDDENQLVRNRGRSYHQRRKPALQTEIIDDHEGDTCTHPRCFAVARLHQKCIRHGGSSKCSQPGCNKNAFAKGKCVKHRSWTRQESITRYLTKIPVKDTRMDEQDAKPTLGIQTGSAFVTTSSAVKGKEKTEKKTTASSMHTGAQIRNDFTAVPTRTTTVLTSYNSRPHYTTEGNVSYSRPVCIAYANPNSYSTDINSQCEGGICLNPTCTSLAQANGFCINHNLRAELPFALAQEWRA